MTHLGIIPDGNRRWCKREGKTHTSLLKEWIRQVAQVMEEYPSARPDRWKYLRDVRELSVYICSIDNLRRADQTMKTIYDFLAEFGDTLIAWYNEHGPAILKVNVIGQIELLEPECRALLEKVCKLYASTDATFTLNLAVAYDYEEDVKNHGVFTDPFYDTRGMSQIDLILRTGGDRRTSGFFPTKSYYAELFFIRDLWPDLTLDILNSVAKRFRKRVRRFGK